MLPLAGVEEVTRRLEQSENGPNHFTESHLLLALSIAPAVAEDLGHPEAGSVRRELFAARTKLADGLSAGLETDGALPLQPGDPARHSFVTLHALRALDLAGIDVDVAEARVAASSSTLRHLAYYSADVLARFDPGEFVFGATLLGRLKVSDRRQLTDRAARIVLDAQTDDGAWLSEQIVGASEGRIFVSSYEVALSLTYLALRELAHGDTGFAWTILPGLRRAMKLVRANYISEDERDDDYRGWANDRSRWQKLVESWATASVVSFLLRYRDVLLGLRQELVLTRYRAQRFDLDDEPSDWPDTDRAAGEPPSLNADALAGYSDPTDGRALTGALDEKILGPALAEPGQRPERASLILHGDPGTRKTSLVKASAEALRWPMVTLSPPDFLGDGGLEGFEVSAARIFEDLMRLRRTVVFFDECEDFFKPRRPGQQDTRLRSTFRCAGDRVPRTTDRTA